MCLLISHPILLGLIPAKVPRLQSPVAEIDADQPSALHVTLTVGEPGMNGI